MMTPDAPYYYFESEHSFDIAKWYPEKDRIHMIMIRASIWWKWDYNEHLTEEQLKYSGELSYEEAEAVAKAEVDRLNAEYRKKQNNV